MPSNCPKGLLVAHHSRPIRRALVVAIVHGFVATQALNATAQANQTFELEWGSPPACPQQLDVTEQIRATLGAVAGATLPSGLRAKGVIEPIDERFQLRLTVRVGQTERTRVIVSDDCVSLGKAASIVLGLLLRREHESGHELSGTDLERDFQAPTIAQQPTSTAPPTAKSNAVEPSPRPQQPVATAQTHDASTPRRWQLLFMLPVATVDFFTLPHAGYGLGVAAGVMSGSWRWFALGTVWRTEHTEPNRTEPDRTELYRATFTRKSFESWVCRGWSKDMFELSPCILAAVDIIGASASGDRLTTKPSNFALVSGGAGLMGVLHLSNYSGLFLSVTGRLTLRRGQFEVSTMQQTEQAHTVPWATMLTSIGTQWFF